MAFSQSMVRLRNELARLYRREADIVRLLEDPSVDIDVAYVEWHDRPVNTWHGILTRAGNLGKLGQIIAVACRENPGVPALVEAQEEVPLTGSPGPSGQPAGAHTLSPRPDAAPAGTGAATNPAEDAPPTAGQGDGRQVGDEAETAAPLDLAPVGNQYALLVGINHYVEPMYSGLRFCVNDAQALELVLTDLGYQVITLHDDQTREHLLPTRHNVEAELRRVCTRAQENDVLLVYFAGHGQIVDGQRVLITREVRNDMVEEHALPLSWVREQLQRGTAARRKALILDACHVGLDIGRGYVTDPDFVRNVHELAEGFALIAASTSQQRAHERNGHGVFSCFMLQALRGEAAHGRDFVTVRDLENYVLNQVRGFNAREGLSQDPTFEYRGIGDFIIADYRQRGQPGPDPANAPRRPNPFGDRGRISDPARFFDREELLRQLFEQLSRGGNCSLVGESQVGKSSILAMVCRLGPERIRATIDGYIYLDMQIIHDENQFFFALCDELGIPNCRGYPLARAVRGKRFILCLDEVEKMAHGHFTGDERSELRGLSEGEDAPFTLLIASRSPLEQLFPDSPVLTSPLAGICTRFAVNRFSPEVARGFVVSRLQGTGVSFTRAEMDNLISETGGHPRELQTAAAALFDSHTTPARGEGRRLGS